MAEATASPAPASPAAPATPAPAAPSAAAPGASPTPGSPSATPAPPSSPNDANLRQLREGYEAYKQLGELDTLQPEVQGYRGAIAKVQELATNLGYTAESVQKAFLADPVATIQALQQEAQSRARNPQSRPDPNADPRSMIRQEMAPVLEHVQRQMAEAANGKFDSEFGALLGQHAEFKDCPDDVRTAIYDMTAESLKYDQPAMQRLLQGKSSDIKKHFDLVAERFLKVMNAHSQWKGNKPAAQPGSPAAPAATPKISLDDIINGRENAEAAMPSLRR